MAKNVLKVDLTFRQRLTALRNLPELFRLVWQSSPGKTTLSFVLRIARSAMPVALLYVGKLIIDQVVSLNIHGGSYHRLWELVALEFCIAVVTDGLNRMINLTDSLLGDLFSTVSGQSEPMDASLYANNTSFNEAEDRLTFHPIAGSDVNRTSSDGGAEDGEYLFHNFNNLIGAGGLIAGIEENAVRPNAGKIANAIDKYIGIGTNAENLKMLGKFSGNLNKVGQGFFFLGAAVSGVQMGTALYNGDYGAAGKAGLDIFMSGVGTYGGVPGLIIGGIYYGVDGYYPGGWSGLGNDIKTYIDQMQIDNATHDDDLYWHIH